MLAVFPMVLLHSLSVPDDERCLSSPSNVEQSHETLVEGARELSIVVHKTHLVDGQVCLRREIMAMLPGAI